MSAARPNAPRVRPGRRARATAEGEGAEAKGAGGSTFSGMSTAIAAGSGCLVLIGAVAAHQRGHLDFTAGEDPLLSTITCVLALGVSCALFSSHSEWLVPAAVFLCAFALCILLPYWFVGWPGVFVVVWFSWLGS